MTPSRIIATRSPLHTALNNVWRLAKLWSRPEISRRRRFTLMNICARNPAAAPPISRLPTWLRQEPRTEDAVAHYQRAIYGGWPIAAALARIGRISSSFNLCAQPSMIRRARSASMPR
jgi:hypothetical protein